MAIKRNNGRKPASSKKTSKRPSDGIPNQSVKGVQSVNPIGGFEENEVPHATRGSGPIEWIRSGISTLGSGIGNAFKSGMSNLFGLKSVANFAKTGVTKISDATNLSVKVTSFLLAGTLLVGTGGGVMAFANYRANMLLVRQEDYEDDCAEDLEKSKVAASGGPAGSMEEYAAKAWAVAKAFGLSDEQAAGMLGNMQTESGMDPTTIEAIYNEPFDINGTQKQAAAQDLCAYTRTTMRQKYVNSGWGIRQHTTSAGCTMAGASGSPNILSSAYEGVDGHYFPGIGLFGFTGPEGNALVEYAASANGYEWWDFDLQMAFIFDTTGGYDRASWVESWKGQAVSSPAAAAHDWNIHFEGNAGDFAGDKRQARATDWYNKFKGTTGDAAYGQSIIALANSIQGGSQSASYAKAEEECAEAENTNADNSDLARAAVAYAYETTDQGRGNDGTELYRFVHDNVYPGDGWYQSCDRGVACAVRWSDTDDDFPAGDTGMQDSYLSGASGNWQMIGTFTGNIDELQPGDVLVTTSARRGTACGHIVVYVSNEVVREKYPTSDASFVSASFRERSPGCETYTSGKFVGDGYHIYRNIKKTEPGQYAHITDGKSLNDR